MQLILNEYRRRVQTTGAISLRRYPTIRNIHCAYCDPTDTDNNVIVEGFNPATNQLEPVTTISLNTPLKHFGLTMYREKLFIVGGTQDPGYRRDVNVLGGDFYCKNLILSAILSLQMESFDLQTMQINKYLPEMNVSRGFISPLAINGKIYVFGGFNGEAALNSCEWFVVDVSFSTFSDLGF